MLVCPGCGARNDATARACEWCGRPFVDERPRFAFSWAAPIAMIGLAALVGLTVMISLLGAMLLPARTHPASDSPPATATVEVPFHPIDAPVEIETGAAPPSIPTEVAEMPVAPALAVASPTAEPTVETVEFVRIGNTDRQGAFIRREPRAGAPGIVALRDGTVLKIVGPDVLVDGRPWRPVEDQQRNRGWIAREYLLPSPTGF